MDQAAHKATRIEAALQAARVRVPAADHELLETFAQVFFARADLEDLNGRSAAELAAALAATFAAARRRSAAGPQLAVLAGAPGARATAISIVNDDMPFLVDSVIMEIQRQGLGLRWILHPLLGAQRDVAGGLTALAPHGAAGSTAESVMYVEVDRLPDAAAREALAAGLIRVLGDVRAVVADWPAMRAALAAAADELAALPPALPEAELAECREFIRWLAADHLVLLGYSRLDLGTRDGHTGLARVAGSGRGLLAAEAGPDFAPLNGAALAVARQPWPLIVTKANARATVHRPGYVDYIGIKRYDAQGQVVGEHRFLGLLTSGAYAARVAEIPLLRGKARAVLARAGLAAGSHLAKAAAHVIETYPRDELLQIETDALLETVTGILALGERQRLRLFLRHDPFERFVVCLIYVPRDAYGTELRMKFQALLMQAFAGSANEFDVLLTEDALARIQITVRTTPGAVPAVDRAALEAQLTVAARRWEDRLRDALLAAHDEALALPWQRRWAAAFPAAYREQEPVEVAVADIARIESLGAARAGYALYAPRAAAPGRLGFKLYHADAAVPLSDSLPMLESMGVRALEEHPYRLTDAQGAVWWIHDFLLEAPAALGLDVAALAPVFEDVFARMAAGAAERDGFNRLVLAAGLDAAAITVLRAYAKYLKQARFDIAQDSIEATLAEHPAIAHQLAHLFRLRFDPEHADPEAAATQVRAIEQALEKVARLNEDRVLRQLLALMLATLRTNAYRGRSLVAFKFDSAAVPGLPEPRPWVEVFVYSPRFEGIHLRGGKVARGGLRWSDRPEDFRTEVLGLVKAQRVKNTVIVPVGSKGGFVLKKAPPAAEREAYLAEGVACYQDYLRGLLDLTDNWVAGAVVPPERVLRHDGDDPYLVVAADKGTASFSDYANAVSAEYGFWLGDAFASGGSVGYDHKKMGITARGAWEAVKRHFRELGRDIQAEPFSCVGIGDMSGDVFGNGMLLSRATCLVAAFDHRHIFIDPAPDSAISYAERERLFALPRSSWTDYDARLISAGGGVWSRAEKTIPVSPEAAAVLGIAPGRLAPNELIRAILKAPVDLLYNGGIGTYVKAAAETHAEVGDRASDALRVNGAELRAKVVGEGGNLGFTQRGRIEFALAGGRINTDAIDNSAGVDTSDHEVNIKILLGAEVAAGRLSLQARNALLASMTDEVAQLVLADNIAQTRVLSVGGRVAARQLDSHARFMAFLARSGKLDRAIEFLPDDAALAERRARGLGLTTPERAVLLAYSKIWLRGELLASDLPEDAWVARVLPGYFPAALRADYAAAIAAHPLRREIIVTGVLNDMVNRVGPSFVHRVSEATGAAAPQVVRAWLLAVEVFGLGAVWRELDALEACVADATLAEMLVELGRLTLRATSWLARSRRLAAPIAATAVALAPAVAVLDAQLAAAGCGRELATRWVAAGVPAVRAQRVACAEASLAALDIAEVAAATGRAVAEVTQIHAALDEALALVGLRAQIAALPAEDHWQALARSAAADELAAASRALCAQVAALPGDARAARAMWQSASAAPIARLRQVLAELAEARRVDLAMVSVVLRELRGLG